MSVARDERLYFALQIAAARLRTDADRRCVEHGGVTAAQAAALAVVRELPGVTQRGLALALGQAEASITALVRRLVASGFVARDVSPTDARAWSLALTEAGRRALESADEGFAAVNERIDSLLTEQEVRRLAKLLRRLA